MPVTQCHVIENLVSPRKNITPPLPQFFFSQYFDFVLMSQELYRCHKETINKSASKPRKPKIRNAKLENTLQRKMVFAIFRYNFSVLGSLLVPSPQLNSSIYTEFFKTEMTYPAASISLATKKQYPKP